VSRLVVDEADLIDDPQRGNIERLVNTILARNRDAWLIMSRLHYLRNPPPPWCPGTPWNLSSSPPG
jgi:hypothetical protein